MTAALANIIATGMTIAFIALFIALVLAVRNSNRVSPYEPIENGDFEE